MNNKFNPYLDINFDVNWRRMATKTHLEYDDLSQEDFSLPVCQFVLYKKY
jgi:hypothetical protein